MTSMNADKRFDVREIPCAVKHERIFERWSALAVEDYFVLCNGHDPLPLREHFELELGDAFGWEYLTRQKGLIEIKISKLRAAHPSPEVGQFRCGGDH